MRVPRRANDAGRRDGSGRLPEPGFQGFDARNRRDAPVLGVEALETNRPVASARSSRSDRSVSAGAPQALDGAGAIGWIEREELPACRRNSGSLSDTAAGVIDLMRSRRSPRMRVAVVKAGYDDEAGVWYVQSSDVEGLRVEGDTFEAFCRAVEGAVADLLEGQASEVSIEVIAHASLRARIAA
jgi:hypothetical protein